MYPKYNHPHHPFVAAVQVVVEVPAADTLTCSVQAVDSSPKFGVGIKKLCAPTINSRSCPRHGPDMGIHVLYNLCRRLTMQCSNSVRVPYASLHANARHFIHNDASLPVEQRPGQFPDRSRASSFAPTANRSATATLCCVPHG